MGSQVIDPIILINALIEKQQKDNSQFALLMKAMLDGELIKTVHDLRFDHIRFLTANLPSMEKSLFEEVLLPMGYNQSGIEIKQQAITTYSYFHPQRYFPRIDIDVAEIERLPDYLQKIVKHYADQIPEEESPIASKTESTLKNALFSKRWEQPTLGHYKVLTEDHPMLAYLLYHRSPVSTLVLQIDNLPQGYNAYRDFLDYLGGLGMKLDRSKDKLHAMEGGALHTFNTRPSSHMATFADGEEIEVNNEFLMFAVQRTVWHNKKIMV